MCFNSFEEAVSFAIEKEKEAAAFYEELIAQEIFSGNRKIFEKFAIEERKHRTMLEDLNRNSKKMYEYQL